MVRLPRSLSSTRPVSRLPQVKVAPVVEAWSSPPRKFWPKVVNGIANALSVTIALRLWTPLLLAMVLTVMFTVKLATAKNGDLTVMDSLAVAVSCRPMG